MSHVAEMIAELCPGGVPYQPISSVVERIEKIRWADVPGQEFEYVDLGSVDRETRAIGETQRVAAADAPSRAQQILREGDVLFGTTRPLLKRYTVVPAEYDLQIASSGFCVLRPKANALLSEYLYHILGTDSFYTYVEANQRGGGYPAIPDKVVKGYRIPVPPLDVQREIVGVLSLFTGLDVELRAELEGRRLQCAHYRSRLLTYGPGGQVSWESLEDVAKFQNAKAHEKYVDPDGDVALMTAKFISTQSQSVRFVKSADVQTPALKDDIALVMSDLPNGRALARAFFVDQDGRYAANQRVCLLTVKDQAQLLPRFLYYLMDRNPQLLAYDSGVDQTHLKKGQILGVKVPVPPMRDQERVVSVLDLFDALVREVSGSIPFELASRRAQYDVYRERLLRFEGPSND